MNPNYYKKQRERAWSRKLELIEMMGCKCSKCGYNANIAALEFHHTDPSNKQFQLDSRHLSNTSMEKILDEEKKCVLLCSNCHKETHYPEMEMDLLKSKKLDNKSITQPKRKQSICPVCGKSFDAVKGVKYCSKKCRIASKNYPSKKEVEAKYEELKSKQKVADFYGLTRKIIIGILKREE